MPEQNFGDPMREVWQSQKPVLKPIEPGQLRRAVWRLRWRSRIDDLLAITTNTILGLLFTAAAIFGDVALCRIGSALLAVGFGFTAFRFLAGSAKLDPVSRSEACLDYYRSELARRANFIEGYSRWGVVSTFPGALVGTLGWVLTDPRGWLLPAEILAFFLAMQYINFAWGNRLLTQLRGEINRVNRAA